MRELSLPSSLTRLERARSDSGSGGLAPRARRYASEAISKSASPAQTVASVGVSPHAVSLDVLTPCHRLIRFLVSHSVTAVPLIGASETSIALAISLSKEESPLMSQILHAARLRIARTE